MPRAAGSKRPVAAPATKRSTKRATKVVKKSGSRLAMPRMTSPTTICGLRGWRSAHQPASGSEMSLAMGQAATMSPSSAALMPCSWTYSGSTGRRAPKPIMTMSSVTRSGRSGAHRSSQAETRPGRRVRGGIESSVAFAGVVAARPSAGRCGHEPLGSAHVRSSIARPIVRGSRCADSSCSRSAPPSSWPSRA